MGCTFCEMYKNEKGIVYKGKFFFAIFDRFPVSPGHLEIIPKRHIASLFDLSHEE